MTDNETKGIPYDGPLTMLRAEVLLARGEMTFEEVLKGIEDGSIEPPEIEPPVDPESPTWWDDVEAHASVPPFSSVRQAKKITPEQYVQLRNAISKARGIPEDQWLRE